MLPGKPTHTGLDIAGSPGLGLSPVAVEGEPESRGSG